MLAGSSAPRTSELTLFGSRARFAPGSGTGSSHPTTAALAVAAFLFMARTANMRERKLVRAVGAKLKSFGKSSSNMPTLTEIEARRGALLGLVGVALAVARASSAAMAGSSEPSSNVSTRHSGAEWRWGVDELAEGSCRTAKQDVDEVAGPARCEITDAIGGEHLADVVVAEHVAHLG